MPAVRNQVWDPIGGRRRERAIARPSAALRGRGELSNDGLTKSRQRVRWCKVAEPHVHPLNAPPGERPEVVDELGRRTNDRCGTEAPVRGVFDLRTCGGAG